MNARVLTFTLASLIGCSSITQPSFQNKTQAESNSTVKAEEKDLDTLLEEHQKKLCDGGSLKGTEYLKENEYVVPENIMNAFMKAWRPKDKSGALGLYIIASPGQKTKDVFEWEIDILDISGEEKEIYSYLFSLGKVIIYKRNIFEPKKSIFERDLSEETRLHEQGHEYWYIVLTPAEREILEEAYEGLQGTEISIESYKYNTKKPPKNIGEWLSLGEFYATLVERGTHPPKIKELLQKNYPEAYQISEKMKKTIRELNEKAYK